MQEESAREIAKKLKELEVKFSNDPSILNRKKLENYKNIAIQKFSYLIKRKTLKYRNFINYEDLQQEAYIALARGLKTYNPSKGSIFWWLHHYLDTKISRAANNHSVIRYPLQFSKKTPPHRESKIPVLLEFKKIPEIQLESEQLKFLLERSLENLSDRQKIIINSLYGFEDKPISVARICKKLNLSRKLCLEEIEKSLNILKQNIQI